MVKNAYIHIPFCVKKCNYCAFISYNKLQLKNDYINALIFTANINEKLKSGQDVYVALAEAEKGLKKYLLTYIIKD